MDFKFLALAALCVLFTCDLGSSHLFKTKFKYGKLWVLGPRWVAFTHPKLPLPVPLPVPVIIKKPHLHKFLRGAAIGYGAGALVGAGVGAGGGFVAGKAVGAKLVAAGAALAHKPAPVFNIPLPQLSFAVAKSAPEPAPAPAHYVHVHKPQPAKHVSGGIQITIGGDD